MLLQSLILFRRYRIKIPSMQIDCVLESFSPEIEIDLMSALAWVSSLEILELSSYENDVSHISQLKESLRSFAHT